MTESADPLTSPASLKSDYLQSLYARGYVHQCTDVGALDALMARQSVPCYIGFDATATGQLVPDAGLQPLAPNGSLRRTHAPTSTSPVLDGAF